MTAARAAVEIRTVGQLAAVIANDHFGCVGHHVNRPPRPVDDSLRMALPELHVVSGMAGICTRRGVSAPQRGRHSGVADCAGVSAVPYALELAVPSVGWRNPDFEPDVRVARRPGSRLDPTEGRDGHRALSAWRR